MWYVTDRMDGRREIEHASMGLAHTRPIIVAQRIGLTRQMQDIVGRAWASVCALYISKWAFQSGSNTTVIGLYD